MREIFKALLFLLARSVEDDLRRQVEFFKAENEMLRWRVPKQRIFLKPHERERLLTLGLALGPGIRHVITIVSYSTFRRWVRKAEEGQGTAKVGRPKIPVCIRELVLRIARETGWGYSRILGELKKLRVGRISRQTVRNILKENGIDPGPRRGRGSWSYFLEAHSETLWQCDFFSKRIWTRFGPRQMFALAFIHLGTRRVFVTPATDSTNSRWMVEQARAFLDYAGEQDIPCEILIRDYDGAFSGAFDQAFEDRGIQVKPVGPRAPNMNAFIERWIQSLQQEALDHFIVFGKAHFDYIVSEYVTYDLECRPHQSLDNRLVLLPREKLANDGDDEAFGFGGRTTVFVSVGRLKRYDEDENPGADSGDVRFAAQG